MHSIYLLWVILIAASSASSSILDAPFENRILVAVDPMSFAAGLCPGHPLAGTAGPSLPRSRAIDHENARVAASLNYVLGDLQTSPNGKAYVEGISNFLRSFPPGYELYFAVSEPVAGLKYMILKSLDDSPWIFAIAGTAGTLDWIVDLDLGGPQLERLTTAMGMLTTCQYQDDKGQPLASHKFIITGHSLGGGLAQAVAYEVQKRRLSNGLKPIDMQLITFNSFGAKALINRTAPYNPRIEPYLNATHYFVLGDLVSRIGEHCGPTRQLTPPGVDPNSSVSIYKPSEIKRLHSMDLIEQIPLASAQLRPVTEIQAIRALLGAGSILSEFLNSIYQDHRDEKINALLTQAVEELGHMPLFKPQREATRQFVKRAIFSHQLDMEKPSNGPMADLRVREMKALLLKLDRTL